MGFNFLNYPREMSEGGFHTDQANYLTITASSKLPSLKLKADLTNYPDLIKEGSC